ncbi:hypothetical protein TI39_contig4159g00024 [Zymoseptoria brevis]|uniref:Uncharacterized protein n=1 Tax=Zymoseptoria brevis TaxID=1047168 RepID=A0A0F4GBM9_9PEZI|nr:hypothetical protein TI39_contig4159g00024 [Zymoseptoria brevis]
MGEMEIIAGIAWATPVSPDKLVPHLKSFEKILPHLRTLRLCHRFGQGPDVHITKLPAELELLIEESFLSSGWSRSRYYDAFEWEQDFKCFESRCTPLSHIGDSTPLWEMITDNFDYCGRCPGYIYPFDDCETHCKNSSTADPCEACKAGNSRQTCEKSCDGQLAFEQQTAASESDYWFEDHMDARSRWEKRVSAEEAGKINTTLRQHFGLEATFSTTRAYKPPADKWPKDINYRWHDECHRETTICHLTIPRPEQRQDKFLTSDMEDSIGCFNIRGTQTIAIDTNCHLSSAEMSRRFRKAMMYLDLEPAPHPSQNYCKLRSLAEEPASRKSTDAAESTKKAEHSAQTTTQSEWPKLVVTISAKVDLY